MAIYPPPTRTFGWQYWNAKVDQLNIGSGGNTPINVTSSELYDLTVNSQLTPGAKYRITDYKSVNWLNGFSGADGSYPSTTGSIITPTASVINPFQYNSNLSGGFDGPPYVIKKSSTGKYYIGGNFSSYNGYTNWGFTRVNADGTKDLTFNNSYLPSGLAYDIVENADGTIFVGGDLPGIINVRKILPTGALDTSFTTSTYNKAVQALALQSDGKLLVGGAFAVKNGQPRNALVRLFPNGSEDTVFLTNIGTGCAGDVVDIMILPDDSMIIVGNFSSFNGTAVGRIVKLNPDGTLNTAFNTNAGTGFDANVVKIRYHAPTNSYVITGNFTTYNGVANPKIIRINADGTIASGWVGGAVFNGLLNAITVQNDGKIMVGGNFTTVNGNPSESIVRLTANGVPDLFIAPGFNLDVVELFYDPASTIIVTGGSFTSYDIATTNYITALASANTPTLNYNPLEIYTSPKEEVIIMTALSENRFEIEGYSETYGDIVEFLPYCNTYGLPYPNGINNGVTLPDSTVVSGFDVQWDGTNAYFMMPANNPLNFGHLFYVDFAIAGSNDWEFFTDPVLPGLNNINSEDQGYPNAYIDVSADGMKVILVGVTEQMVLNYIPDSLYVDAVFSMAPAYGYMTRRIDVSNKVDMPLDWRNIVHRRWQSDTGSNDYIVTNDNGTTGNYQDFNPLPKDIHGTVFVGRGGTTGYWFWNGTVENIVVRSYGFNNHFNIDYMSSSTFNGIGNNDIFGSYFYRNSFAMAENMLLMTSYDTDCVGLANCRGTAYFGNLKASIMFNIDFQLHNGTSLGGDVTASTLLGNSSSKRMIMGSDATIYIEEFDGTSLNYTTSPF